MSVFDPLRTFRSESRLPQVNVGLRALILVATTGWLVPLCASFWATYDFLTKVVWPAAAWDKPYQASWHPFGYADELFYFSMLWLGAVLVGWSIALTRHNGGS